ncbi:MAG: XRE family transcriptional regulator [Lachnospiraceae bacterium]|nr:XRE family transcriptional regulator [Lachnospiraceae bacterium]
MAYTRFGEIVRVLRIKHHEVMGDMAKVLDTSLPFLSAVENGKKNVPGEWVNKLVEHYGLTDDEKKDMEEAIEESKVQFKISSKNAGNIQRKTVLAFARAFDEMDDDTALKILKLLSKKGDT